MRELFQLPVFYMKLNEAIKCAWVWKCLFLCKYISFHLPVLWSILGLLRDQPRVLGWIMFNLTTLDAAPPHMRTSPAEYHYIPCMWTLTARYVTYLIWSQFSGTELMGWFGNKIFSRGLWLNSKLSSAGLPCPRLQPRCSRVFIKA